MSPSTASERRTPRSQDGAENLGRVYHFIARVIDPATPADLSLLAELQAMHPRDRENAVTLMTTMTRNFGCSAMWEAQMKLMVEGKPTFLTPGGGPGGLWASYPSSGATVDVGGGLFRSGGGGDAPPLAGRAFAGPGAQLYARPAFPVPALPQLPFHYASAGAAEPAAAAPGAGARELLLPMMMQASAAPAALPEALLLPPTLPGEPPLLAPLLSLDALLAAPPPLDMA